MRPRHIAVTLMWPYLALVGAALMAAAALYRSGRRFPALQDRRLALLAAAVTGFGLPSGVDQIVQQTIMHPNQYRLVIAQNSRLAAGTLQAGRWLRDHSDPNDLVATNAHCRSQAPNPCAPYHFAAAAFSERRFLVEGWEYTATLQAKRQEPGQANAIIPFWRPDLLATNDAAFQRPSAATVGRLRTEYGVRWLFAELKPVPPGADLGKFATLRFRYADCAIYELTG